MGVVPVASNLGGGWREAGPMAAATLGLAEAAVAGGSALTAAEEAAHEGSAGHADDGDHREASEQASHVSKSLRADLREERIVLVGAPRGNARPSSVTAVREAR